VVADWLLLLLLLLRSTAYDKLLATGVFIETCTAHGPLSVAVLCCIATRSGDESYAVLPLLALSLEVATLSTHRRIHDGVLAA